MLRRSFLTSLPVLAFALVAPCALAAPPELLLPRLADLFAVVERRDMRVLTVVVGPRTFDRLAAESGERPGVDPKVQRVSGNGSVFRYWNADFLMVQGADEDKVLLVGRADGSRASETNFFHLFWSSDEGERTYLDEGSSEKPCVVSSSP